ncbi:hypothetical protein E2C01_067901 [Portunus trituberculatus]|uniref:Uncharacterized protein n=1 Tax=Portunus trituberculatus TaxID=210409 RepID=A0A5B7HWE9_PORTR|nr:hypothetical protein [Portunus trituberculatus]
MNVMTVRGVVVMSVVMWCGMDSEETFLWLCLRRDVVCGGGDRVVSGGGDGVERRIDVEGDDRDNGDVILEMKREVRDGDSDDEEIR